MNNKEATIVLCGGLINHEKVPLGVNRFDPMIPINGKPVIARILDDIIHKKIEEITLVVWKQDIRLYEYLQSVYAKKLSLAIQVLPGGKTTLQALQLGIKCTPTSGKVRVLFGDTLIKDSFDYDKDYFYIDDRPSDQNGVLNTSAPDVSTTAERHTGFYNFMHGNDLSRHVDTCVDMGKGRIWELINSYGEDHVMERMVVKERYRFGNMLELLEARRNLLKPRDFNKLSINPVLNSITKVSKYGEKLHEELDWCLNIPDELKVLTPRILSHGYENGRLKIVEEYYGYPDLSDIYVYGDLPHDHWLRILTNLFKIHQEFRKFSGDLDPAEIQSVYIANTWQRIDILRNQGEDWDELIKRPELVVNGNEYLGIISLKEELENFAAKVAATADICIIHGDFSLQKILYDAYSQSFRLINPRGSFGRKGIYGDARYDVAKLRQSVCGLVDFIRSGLFNLNIDKNIFSWKIIEYSTSRIIKEHFDRMVAGMGYDLNEIKFIEALHFISIAPNYENEREKQVMLFLTGIKLLNEVLHANSD